MTMKLYSVIDNDITKWDSIIIDEGQDFKELWFETVFKMCERDGYKYVFVDQMQDIFQRNSSLPNNTKFFKYQLNKNCRNTKNIVEYLSDIINQEIASHQESPVGEKVSIKTFETEDELVRTLSNEINILIKKQGIKPEQILLMPNSPINESSISKLRKIGKVPITTLKRNGKMKKGEIHYSSINIFKGLEIDILFIIDAHKVTKSNREKMFYTQISRGKNKVYIYSLTSS